MRILLPIFKVATMSAMVVIGISVGTIIFVLPGGLLIAYPLVQFARKRSTLVQSLEKHCRDKIRGAFPRAFKKTGA